MRRALLSMCLLPVGCTPHLLCADAVGELPFGCSLPQGDVDADGGWVAPDNTWPSHVPPADLVAGGMGVGEVAYDVRGLDQHGDTFSLWQLYGEIVVFDVSTMWCRPCQHLALGTEHTWQTYRDRGVVYVTVLIQDLADGDVSVDELQTWADLPDPTEPEFLDEAGNEPNPNYAWGDDVITAPIVADNQGVSGSADAVRFNQYPAVLVLGRDMKVRARGEAGGGQVTHATIEAAIEDALAAEPPQN